MFLEDDVTEIHKLDFSESVPPIIHDKLGASLDKNSGKSVHLACTKEHYRESFQHQVKRNVCLQLIEVSTFSMYKEHYRSEHV